MYRLSLYNPRNNSYKIISGWELHASMGYFPEEAAYIGDSTLKDIVSFTSLFENESDLKNTLLDAGFISEQDLDSKFLIIRTSKNGKIVKTLKEGISYKRDAHLYDINELKRHVVERMDNQEFMTSFSYSFCNYLRDVKHIKDQAIFIYDYYVNRITETKTEEELAIEIRRFIDKYCTREKSKGVYTEDFYKVRQMAMFVAKYEARERERELREQRGQINDTIKEIKYLEMRLEYLKDQLARIPKYSEEYQAFENEINSIMNK